MARTEIFEVNLPFQGNVDIFSNEVAVDAVNGNMIANDGKDSILISNGSGGDLDITIVAVPDESGRAEDMEITLPNNGVVNIGPLDPRFWNQKTGSDAGKVYLDFSTGTNVTIVDYHVTL